MMDESGWKENGVDISPNCPRCGSSNTKFCYYNNYSLTQPRYFCKSCRRYWTKGGSLRNVPVGGGCRKTRRPNTKSSASSFTHHNLTHHPSQNCSSSSTTTSSVSDAPNIDLALVYANFLNQKPPHDNNHNSDSPNHVDSNYSSGPSVISTPTASASAGCLTQPPLIDEEGNQMEHYDSVIHGMNFELPPLPGQVEASAVSGLHDNDDMIWSSNSSLQHPTPPFVVDDPLSHDADLLLTDWSHFDFPTRP